MKKILSIIFIALLLVPFSSQQLALAFPPVANQLVPVAVIDTFQGEGLDAFGITYDPVNDLIWANPPGGTGVLHAYTPLKNLNIGSLPIDAGTLLPEIVGSVGTTPLPVGLAHFEALGFDPNTGKILMHKNGVPFADTIQAFDPFTGLGQISYSTLKNPAIDAAIATAGGTGTAFFDGLDATATDVYWSPEFSSAGRDSWKDAGVFLDNTNPMQTDISAVWVGNGPGTITRWAGIEVSTNFVYAVSETNFGGGGGDRTVATYDLAGNIVAVDPDGSPFANRLEDLAYDGRYLYGAGLNDQRIFIFDIVGPGGFAVGGEIIPINTVSLLLAGVSSSVMWLIPLVVIGGGAFALLRYQVHKQRN